MEKYGIYFIHKFLNNVEMQGKTLQRIVWYVKSKVLIIIISITATTILLSLLLLYSLIILAQ